MRTAISFTVVVVALSSLSACQQMYARMVADSKAIAERLASASSSAADSTAAQNSSASKTSDPQAAPGRVSSQPKPSVKADAPHENAPVADSQSFARNKPAGDGGANRTSIRETPSSGVKASYEPAPSQVAGDSNDAYQRAHSTQVILRDGDISIDFSKDMPVINSRIGIDLNSQ